MVADRRRWRILRELEDWLEKPMLALSAAWLVLLIVELAWTTNRALQVLGLAIWIIFLAEFALRFVLAPRKGPFLARNVLTLLALAAPAFRLLRALRALRFLRFGRLARSATLVRVVGGVNRGMNTLRGGMRRRGFGYVLALTLVVCVLGALGMRAFEADGPSGSDFDSLGDALWWTAMILTTMGSQAWPATAEGRVLALLLSIYAFGVFGYVAAALASFFVGRDQEDAARERDLARLYEEVKALRSEIARRADRDGDAG